MTSLWRKTRGRAHRPATQLPAAYSPRIPRGEPKHRHAEGAHHPLSHGCTISLELRSDLWVNHGTSLLEEGLLYGVVPSEPATEKAPFEQELGVHASPMVARSGCRGLPAAAALRPPGMLPHLGPRARRPAVAHEQYDELSEYTP